MMSGFSGTKAGQAVLGGGFPLLFGGGPGAVDVREGGEVLAEGPLPVLRYPLVRHHLGGELRL